MTRPERSPGEDPQLDTVASNDWYGVLWMMFEVRLDILVGRRQSDPQLHAVHEKLRVALEFGRALGVRDAVSGRHPVDRAGANRLRAAERVTVFELPGQAIGQCRQSDVGVWWYVEAVSGGQLDGAEFVEKHEGPDRALFAGRQRT
ncbi:MAG: hypothetical protein NXI31_20435 [bacterium]|nr:hypothetical protein [bacterium]